jgi:hypothetical protein
MRLICHCIEHRDGPGHLFDPGVRCPRRRRPNPEHAAIIRETDRRCAERGIVPGTAAGARHDALDWDEAEAHPARFGALQEHGGSS